MFDVFNNPFFIVVCYLVGYQNVVIFVLFKMQNAIYQKIEDTLTIK